MGFLENLAQKLIATSVTPSRETEALSEIGKRFTTGMRTFAGPAIESEIKDIITHEYAVDPYRLKQAKLLGSVLGEKRWVELVEKFEKTRDELLKWQEPKYEYRPKMKIEIKKGIFNIPKGKYAGHKIKILKDNSYIIYDKEGKKIGSGENAAKIIDEDIKKLIITETPTGEKEKVLVAGSEKSKAELEKELKKLREEINIVIPGRSELDALLKQYGGKIKLGTGAAGRAKESWEKFKSFDAYMKSTDTTIDKELTWKRGKYLIKSFLRNVNANLTGEAREKFGKAFNVENVAVTYFNRLDKDELLKYLNLFKENLNKELAKLNNIKDEALKKMKLYEIAYRYSDLTTDNIVDGISQAAGDILLIKIFKDANLTWKDFEGGKTAFPRYRNDLGASIRSFIEENELEDDLKKEGKSLFKAIVKRLPIKVKKSPEKIKKKLRKELLQGDLKYFAPKSKKELTNPTDERTKEWINLFKIAFERNPTWNEVAQLKIDEELQKEFEKKKYETIMGTKPIMEIKSTIK